MDLKLNDKVVLVTGGTGGIGKAIVKGFLKEGAKVAFSSTSQAKIDALLPELMKKEAVACCEVGSGVIPVRYEQRQAREATGRLCIQLAARAEKVVRMVAGIPTVIKGS